MPSEHKHISRAQNNEQFYSSFNLSTTPFIDWAVTALFYSSLHYLDAYFATYPAGGMHPHSHAARDFHVARDSFTKNLYSSYRELKDRSEDARYNLISFNPTSVAILEIQDFQKIRNSIRGHLAL